MTDGGGGGAYRHEERGARQGCIGMCLVGSFGRRARAFCGTGLAAFLLRVAQRLPARPSNTPDWGSQLGKQPGGRPQRLCTRRVNAGPPGRMEDALQGGHNAAGPCVQGGGADQAPPRIPPGNWRQPPEEHRGTTMHKSAPRPCARGGGPSPHRPGRQRPTRAKAAGSREQQLQWQQAQAAARLLCRLPAPLTGWRRRHRPAAPASGTACKDGRLRQTAVRRRQKAGREARETGGAAAKAV